MSSTYFLSRERKRERNIVDISITFEPPTKELGTVEDTARLLRDRIQAPATGTTATYPLMDHIYPVLIINP